MLLSEREFLDAARSDKMTGFLLYEPLLLNMWDVDTVVMPSVSRRRRRSSSTTKPCVFQWHETIPFETYGRTRTSLWFGHTCYTPETNVYGMKITFLFTKASLSPYIAFDEDHADFLHPYNINGCSDGPDSVAGIPGEYIKCVFKLNEKKPNDLFAPQNNVGIYFDEGWDKEWYYSYEFIEEPFNLYWEPNGVTLTRNLSTTDGFFYRLNPPNSSTPWP